MPVRNDGQRGQRPSCHSDRSARQWAAADNSGHPQWASGRRTHHTVGHREKYTLSPAAMQAINEWGKWLDRTVPSRRPRRLARITLRCPMAIITAQYPALQKRAVTRGGNGMGRFRHDPVSQSSPSSHLILDLCIGHFVPGFPE